MLPRKEELPATIVAPQHGNEVTAILVTWRKKIGTCIRGKDEVVDLFAGGMSRYVRREGDVFELTDEKTQTL